MVKPFTLGAPTSSSAADGDVGVPRNSSKEASRKLFMKAPHEGIHESSQDVSQEWYSRGYLPHRDALA